MQCSPEEAKAAKAFLTIVFGQRIDWDHEHFEKTPERLVKMLRELTMPENFTFTTFKSNIDEMVVVKDIDYVSLCAHHIVPYIGRCHVAYIPQGKIVGLSKIARLVRAQSKSLSVQEELTDTIASKLWQYLNPLGVAVVMEGEHMCMSIRGVQAPGAKTVTSKMLGVFLDSNKQARQEFLQIINRNGH